MDDLLNQKNLSIKEKKNIYLAVVCGCLEEIHINTPGPEHKRRKRVVRDFRQELLNYVAPRLPPVADHNMELFINTIKASDIVMQDIIKNTSQKTHVLLNLAAICMNELPVRDEHHKKFNNLFDMWEDAYKSNDVRSGDRIFLRIESEVQILTAQRGGVLL